ncbi:LysR family transcriptional regulator [Mitsuaria sp. GD03876]|uniref:LysR family transcriptional regulator n=1 Tax=Mitsuaria sp. GD03876 TaxID=2975399 RepID=UPI00244694D4|nr:LysR family transcriptional regulator [Mitsuaria sp. GD03876]MDH0863333.1 LysR family transcriptional regulator [Mitsuaria sp. GD03876]
MNGFPHLPPMPALRAFEATVRHGSVSKAARELHLTDGAVSRAVRELEGTLGFPLFHRRNRSVVPTPTARHLAEEIADALDRLRDALTRARRAAGPERPLVLSCEPTFLIRWLIPRLGDLQAALGPERELRFVSAGGAVPFAREGIDLAIRRADFPIAEGLRAEPFLDERVGPVCRPEVAAAWAERGDEAAVLLHAATRPAAWTQWAQATGTALRPAREVRFEHFYLSLQAAAAGAGLAIGPVALVADDIDNGLLVAPRGFVADGSRYVLMAPESDVDGETFDAVLAWLKSRAAALASR